MESSEGIVDRFPLCLGQDYVVAFDPISDLIALAPHQRYVVKIRNGNPDRPPDARVLQTAVGTVARLSDAGGVRGEFLLTPADGLLGSAIAALATAGYQVMTCRQERAEIEDAFLALAARETS